MACEQEQQALTAAWQMRLQREAELQFIYNAMLHSQTKCEQSDHDYERARLAKEAADAEFNLALTKKNKNDGIREFLLEQFPIWQQTRNDAIDAHNAALEAYNTCMANPPPPVNEV
jgi:hypothetical protein